VPEKVMDFDIVGYAVRPDVQAHSWSELQPYSVAYITGWKAVEQNLKAARDVTTARDMTQLVDLLANGRADVVVVSRYQGVQRQARAIGVTARRLDPPLSRVPFFTHLHRRHQDLVAPLAAALVELKSDGTWQRMYDQILGPEEAGP
jgi:polar amino acid transport system substrate-binding protein